MWLNLYGREAVRHMLKNGLKHKKCIFLPVLELMSDSLTAIYVKPYQCPSHQSILLTQGPIHEIFMKKYWELAELENEVFLSRPFWIFFLFLFFCFISKKTSSPFIWGIIFSYTMDGFSRILKKRLSELICTRLYCHLFFSTNCFLSCVKRKVFKFKKKICYM